MLSAPEASYYVKRAPRLLGQLRHQLPCFAAALSGHVPSEEIPVVLREMERRYEALLHRIPYIGGGKNPLTENLLISSWFLCLFKSLEARGFSDETLERVAERAAGALVGQRRRWAARLQAWLVQQRFFQWMLARMARRTHQGASADGFRVTFVPGRGQSFDFGYDVTRCAITEFFAAEEAARHAKLMCRVDYLTSALAGLELRRSGTIAQGQSRCDFRFVKLQRGRT